MKEILDLKKFSIAQYGSKYRAMKICSITNKLYSVELTQQEYVSYYTSNRKSTKHLKRFSKNDKLFLETTLTPKEINTLTSIKKKSNKKLWKGYLNENTTIN